MKVIQEMVQIVLGTDNIFYNEQFRKDIKEKGASDYVTRADIEISNFLHKRLKEAFPQVAFLSEEEETQVDKEGDYWILDPIDGTTNFMHRVGLSAVSLALCSAGKMQAGVIYIPQAKELFWAEKGSGAFLNGEKITCSRHEKLSDCLGAFEYNPYFKQEYAFSMQQAAHIYTECQDIRTLGAAAVEMAYVACGRLDVFLGRHLKPWDYAAGLVIIEEAGGKVTNINGAGCLGNQEEHIVATNQKAHAAFLKLCNR